MSRREARLRRAGLAASAALGATALLAASANADTYEVQTTGDGAAAACTPVSATTNSCQNLRDAIGDANTRLGADTVTFKSGLSGTISINTPLTPGNGASGNDLVIEGPGASALTISGEQGAPGPAGNSQLFSVAASSGAVTLSGLTLADGYVAGSGGAIFAGADTTVTLADAVLSGNTATGSGGGVYSQSNVVLEGTEVKSGSANGYGGAVALVAADDGNHVTLTNSRITGNKASGGGGVSVLTATFSGFPKYDTSLTVTGSTLSGNTATTQDGGAVLVEGKYSDVTATSSTISGNHAPAGSGGGISKSSKYGPISFTASTITGNTAQNSGGGIFASGKYGALNLSASTVSANSAGTGGGIALRPSGTGPGAGGGQSTIDHSTVTGNTASGDAGGMSIGVATEDDVEVTHSTISQNTSGASGGGIAFSGQIGGGFMLVDSTISGNAAATGGGVAFPYATGAQLADGASAAFDNSTIARNSASGTGGGIYLASYPGTGGSQSATIPLTSTVVGDNTAAGQPQDLDRADTSPSGGFDAAFSLVEAPGDATVTQNPPGSTILGKDPQLGGLVANGGPTKTLLQATTSPLVDAGDSPPTLTTDQRDEPRRTQNPDVPNAGDGTDIGAVELPAPGPTPPPDPPDTTPPVTRVTKKPKARITTRRRGARVAVRFTSNEAGSTFQCKVDRGAYRVCRSPLRFLAAGARRKGKAHTVLIRATDTAGNTGNPAKVKFKVVRKGRRK